ncbi:MAG: SHOCT domain-containing protein [candidate division Zixibacteria bacterium]|jgi:putative membrane protein|nr:SHOCT domain-containing protein [candidate division Zixibacteria bacterium]
MHFGFGGFGMILVWVATIAVVVVVVKLLSNSTRNRDTKSKTPLQFLEHRYASGEITRDEFEEKKRDLAQR